MTKRIIVMAGGTGGHVFPALAVAQYLRDDGWQVTWLGTEKGLENRVVPENDFVIDYLSVAGFRGKGKLFKLLSMVRLLKSCSQAWRVLKQRQPHVVLGMGGFVSGPGGLMAKCLGIPLVIHEQNRIVGTTNRWLARWANRVLEAFPGSFPKKYQAICTGNPLRQAFLHPCENTKTSTNTIRIAVIGGSQGAQVLNQVVPDAMANLAKTQHLDIKHQTGNTMEHDVALHYQRLGLNADVKAFIDDMVSVYRWADMLICRAGAMTISEVAAVGVPSILVPLPSAIDDHQTANAKYLSDAHGAYLLSQQDLSPTRLAQVAQQVIAQKESMRLATLACARLEATKAVALVCVQEAKL